jgi:tetratricopeptide (TPR) repeat protein
MHSFRQYRYVVPAKTIAYMQASLAAITETGDPYQITFAHFALGFAYLLLGWRGDLDRAEAALQSALDQAEEVGDPVVQCRSWAYLCMVYRKRGEIERVRGEAPGALALAERMKMTEYIASSLGHLAWVAWHEGDLARIQELGERALAAGEEYPVPIPIKWPYLWPLIAVKLANGDLAEVLTYAQMMLAPTHQRLHDDVVAKLELALAADKENRPDTVHLHLEEALQLAQTHLYL